MNLAKSTYDPGPAPKSVIRTYEAFEGDGVKYTQVTINADGSRTTIGFSAHYDGKDYQWTGNVNADTNHWVAIKLIGGPKSHLYAFGGPFAVHPSKGEIMVSVRGPGPFAELSSDEAYVGVWSIKDNGDVPPKWTIGGPHGILRMPRGIALDVKNKNMIVSDKRLNAVLTFHFPEVF